MLGKGKSIIISLLFLIISFLAVFSWYPNAGSYNMIGRGDFVSIPDPFEVFYVNSFVYDFYVYNGYDAAFLTSKLFPFLLILSILSALKLTPAIASLIFISLIIFVSQISMFTFLKYLFYVVLKVKPNVSSTYFIVLGSILYGSSPFLIPTLNPGHVLALISYATFPAVLLLVDSIYRNENIQKNLKAYFLLFITLFFSSSSFGNVGILFVHVLILSAYVITLNLTVLKLPILAFLKKSFFTVTTLFGAFAWWLLPFLGHMDSWLQSNSASQLIEEGNLRIASEQSTLLGNFTGLPFYNIDIYLSGLSVDGLVNFLIGLLFILVFICISYVLYISKNRDLQVIFLITVLALFISKGVNAPFSNAFEVLYETVPGFKIFRRPPSKIYGIIIFFVYTLATYSFYKLSEKYRRITFIGSFLTTFVLLGIFFLSRPRLIPFNLPNYYNDFQQYLESTGAESVYYIPGLTQGRKREMDEGFNYYMGNDYLPYITHASLIYYDNNERIPQFRHRQAVSDLNTKLFTGESICSASRQLGLTHIIVSSEHKFNQGLINTLNGLLLTGADTEQAVRFGNDETGIIAHKLKDECSGSLFGVENGQIEVKSVTPIEHYIKLTGANTAKIHFLKNYSPRWVISLTTKESFEKAPETNLHVLPLEKNFHFKFTNLVPFQKPIAQNEMYNNFANSWTVNINNLHMQSSGLTEDGVVYLKLYYVNQSWFYIGAVTTFFYFITIVLLLLYQKSIEKGR